MMKNSTLLRVAEQAAVRGGRVLMKHFQTSHLTRSPKKDLTWVTKADLESEKTILGYLQKQTPNFHVLAEESSPHMNSVGGYKWIVDPLDGTHNYLHGIPIFAVSVALEYDGEITVGAIYLPYERILIGAEKGKGVFANGQRVKLAPKKLKDSVLAVETYFDQTDITILQAFVGTTTELRIVNSAVSMLAYLALGRINAVVDRVDKPWDWAAGSLIVSEARGIVSDFRGKKLNLYTPSYIAANQGCHHEIVEVLKEMRI